MSCDVENQTRYLWEHAGRVLSTTFSGVAGATIEVLTPGCGSTSLAASARRVRITIMIQGPAL
jgi:hypothetical protein